MSNVGVSEAELATAPGAAVGQVVVSEVELATASAGVARVGISEADLLVGGSAALLPFWRLSDDGEWVPLTGDVFMLRAGKWVQL